MQTPLKKISLKELCKQPIMLDANILMVGIEDRNSNPNCSFENMKTLYMIPLIESFENIIIHDMVFNELDSECKGFIKSFDNITLVPEGNLYGVDPQYTTIFNNIAGHDRMRYNRTSSKDKGEVYSLAYAAFNNINFFSSKEIKIEEIAREVKDLNDVRIITFDIIILLAFIYYVSRNEMSYNRALKSIYKRYCEDVIKRHKLPSTLKG